MKRFQNRKLNRTFIILVTIIGLITPFALSTTISTITTTTTGTTATINWTTDTPANSTINYGIASNLGTIISETVNTTTHSIQLTSLTNSTTYYYNITSCNMTSSCDTNGIYNFTTTDTHNPTISIISPVSNANYTTASIFLNYSASDNTAVDSCLYNLNNAGWILLAGCINTTISCQEGSNNLSLRINDTTNNYIYSNKTFRVDTTGPESPSIYPIPAVVMTDELNISGYINEHNVTITLTLQNTSGSVYYSTNITTTHQAILQGSGTVNQNTPAGQYTITLNGSVSDFTPNSYVLFNNHAPLDYLLYPISSSINIGGLTSVTLGSSLQSSISQGETVLSYNDTKPTSWFRFNINLSRGNTTVRIFGTDFLGNDGSVYTTTINYITNATYSSFNNDLTTNLSLVNITSVDNFTIGSPGSGKILFENSSINLAGANLNNNIRISSNSVFVNSTALPQLNISARITLFNLPFEYAPIILKNTQICLDCSISSYTDSNLTFNVSGFSTYTTTANSQLELFTSGNKSLTNTIIFFSNYTNLTSGASIQNADCNITFNDLNASQTYNSTSGLYEYNRTFSTTGTKTYSVFCTAQDSDGYENATLNGTAYVVNNSAPNMSRVSIASNSPSTTPGTNTNLNCIHLPAIDDDETFIDIIIDSDGNITPYGNIINNYNISSNQVLLDLNGTENLSFYDIDKDSTYDYNGTASSTEPLIIVNDPTLTYNSSTAIVILNMNNLLIEQTNLTKAENITNLKFWDINSNGIYDLGETIVYEPSPNNIFNGDITYTYKWYVKPDNSSEYRACNEFAWCDNDNVEILANGNTAVGDKWICEVTPHDQFDSGTALNSSPITIGTASQSGTGSTIAPILLNISDNSNATSPTTLGNKIKFTINWTDADSRLVRIFICNSTNIIENSGCFDFEFSRNISNKPDLATLEYTPLNSRYTAYTTQPNETYYALACDDSYNCSNILSGTLFINRLPTITNLNLNASDQDTFGDSANLICNAQSTDQDQNSVTYVYKWWLNRSGQGWQQYSIPSNKNLTNGNTLPGDIWRCSATPYDSYAYGAEVNSSDQIIGGSASTLSANITSIIDDSSPINPTNAGSEITFNINWVAPTDQVRAYICNSSLIEDNGCADTTFNRTGMTSQNPIIAKFTAPETYNGTYLYYAKICDQNWNCSTVYPSDDSQNFSINNPPNATVSLVPSSLGPSTSMNCQVNYTDGNGDSENVSLRQYQWYIDSGSGYVLDSETSENHSALPANYKVYCKAKVFDQHLLSSTAFISSQNITVSSAPSLPVIWNTNRIVSTSNITIIGYINETGNVIAFSTQDYNTPKTSTTPAGSLSTLIGSSSVAAELDAGTPYIIIPETDQTIFQIGNYISTSAHNRTNFKRYNITEKTNLLNGQYRINITPDLEAPLQIGNIIQVHTLDNPSGWFNISVALFPGNNTIGIKGENAAGNGSVLNITAYYDQTAPFINTSGTRNATNINESISSTTPIVFNITDNHILNTSSIQAQIQNLTTSSSLQIVCQNLAVNVTACTANYSELPDGRYNITINVTDFAGNRDDTIISNFTIDTSIPTISQVLDNGTIITDKLIFANWTPGSSLSGIQNYEYAIGTAQYPTSGWDNLVSLTDAGSNTSISLSLNLQISTVYYVNVRAKNKAGTYSAFASSDGVLYADSSAPECTLLGATENICAEFPSEFTNDNSSLVIFWNFTDSESGISDYEYSIGNSTYPNQGFENTKARTLTSLNSFTISGLSLQNNNLYYINVKARNNFGIWSDYYTSNNITIDLEDPTNGSISYPDGFLSSNFTFVTLDEGDDGISGIKNVSLEIGTSKLSQQGTCPGMYTFNPVTNLTLINESGGDNISLTALPRGSPRVQVELSNGYCYKFRYLVSDRAGNLKIYPLANETMIAKVDTIAPTNVTITDSGFFTYIGTELDANWSSAEDNESGIAYYEYSVWENTTISGSPISGWTNTTRTNIRITGLALNHQLTYYIKVRAIDNAGLTGSESQSDGIIYLDFTPPDPATVLSVQNDTNSSDGWLDDIQDSNTTILLLSEEAAHCVINDLDIDYSTAWGTNCTTTPNTGNISCNIENLTQGTYTYHVSCQDANGNKQDYSQNTDITFTVDWPEAPEALNTTILTYYPNSSRIPNNSAYTDSILECNATFYDPDNSSTINSSYIIWYNNTNLSSYYRILGAENSTLNLSLPGFDRNMNISCMIQFKDNTNRTSSWENFTIFINNSAPQTPSLISPIGEWISKETDFNWSASYDADNDTITYTLQISNSSSFITINYSESTTHSNTSVNTTSMTDGIYWYRVISCDDSGFENNCSTSSNTTIFLDNMGPNITIISPATNSIVGHAIPIIALIFDNYGFVVNATYNITNNANAEVAYGNLTPIGSNIYSGIWITNDTLHNGTYNITIVAHDNLNNRNNETNHFNVDNSKPSIYINVPNYNARYYQANITLNITIYDFISANLSIRDSASQLVFNATNETLAIHNIEWIESINMENWTEGNFSVEVLAIDNVSNTQEANFTFYLDRTPPAYSDFNISHTRIFNDISPILTVTWPNDFNLVANQYDLQTVIIFYNISGIMMNSTFYPSNSPSGQTTFTTQINASLLNNSLNITWYSTAYDFAGNYNSTPHQNFTVLNRAPILNQTLSLGPISLLEDNSTTLNLSQYFTDPDNNAFHPSSDNLTYSATIYPEHLLFYQSFDNMSSIQIFGNASNVSFQNAYASNGIKIQSGTTNLITNSDFEIASSTNSHIPANWTVFGQPQYNTTGLYNNSGASGIRVNVNNYYYQDVSVIGNRYYSLSAYIKSDTGTRARLHIEWMDSLDRNIGNNLDCSNCSSSPFVNSTFTRYSTTSLAPANAAYARIIIDSDESGYLIIDQVQLEENDAPTDYNDSTRGPSELRYPSASNINLSQGTIAFWFLPLWNSSDISEKVLFSSGNIEIKKNSSNIIFSIGDVLLTADNPVINSLQQIHVAASWNADAATTAELYIDGNMTSSSSSSISVQPGQDMYIGSTSNTTLLADAIFDELAIFDSKLPAEQILQIYNQSLRYNVKTTTSIENSTLTLNSSQNYYGSEKIRIIAYDHRGAYTYTGMIDVNIDPVNDGPVFTSSIKDISSFEDTSAQNIILLDAYFTDIDTTTLSYTLKFPDNLLSCSFEESLTCLQSLDTTRSTNISASNYGPGKIQSGLILNNYSKVIFAPSASPLINNTESTIMLWINPSWNSTSDINITILTIAFANKSISLSFLNNTILAEISPSGTTLSSNVTYNSNEWHHLAFTYNTNNSGNASASFHWDGTLLPENISDTSSFLLNTTAHNITINSPTINSSSINFSVDELQVWKNLNSSEINLIYNYEASSMQTLPINYSVQNTLQNIVNNSAMADFSGDSLADSWSIDNSAGNSFNSSVINLTPSGYAQLINLSTAAGTAGISQNITSRVFRNTTYFGTITYKTSATNSTNFTHFVLLQEFNSTEQTQNITIQLPASQIYTTVNYNHTTQTDVEMLKISLITSTNSSNGTDLIWWSDANLTASGNFLTITPVSDWFGNILANISATDLEYNTSSNNFWINISPVNDAPTTNNLTISFAFNDNSYYELNLSAIFSDTDSTLSYSFSNNTNVSVTESGGIANFTSTSNFGGTEAVIITANDSILWIESIAYITVINLNDPPTLSSGLPQINLTKNTPALNALTISDYFTDPENDNITFSIAYISSDNISATLSNFTAEINSTNISKTNISLSSDMSWYGNATITIQASDSSNTTYANLTINVTTSCPQPLDGTLWIPSAAICTSEILQVNNITINDNNSLSITNVTLSAQNIRLHNFSSLSGVNSTINAALINTSFLSNLSLSNVSANTVLISSGNSSILMKDSSISSQIDIYEDTRLNISSSSARALNIHRSVNLSNSTLSSNFSFTQDSGTSMFSLIIINSSFDTINIMPTNDIAMLITDSNISSINSTGTSIRLSNTSISSSINSISSNLTLINTTAVNTVSGTNQINSSILNLTDSIIASNISISGNSTIIFTSSTLGSATTSLTVEGSDQDTVSTMNGSSTISYINSTIAENSSLRRYYPGFFYNSNQTPLINATVSIRNSTSHLIWNGTTSSGYAEILINFTDTNYQENHLLYVEDVLQISTLSLLTSTPINISVANIDTDRDGIPDRIDDDNDNDGIIDTADPVWGTLSNINTNLTLLNISINNSYDMSANFTGNLSVNITTNGTTLLTFQWNFSQSTLNLFNISLYLLNSTLGNTLTISGIHLTDNNTKIAYLPRINSTATGICIKDNENISTITAGCTGANEVLVTCPGNSSTYGYSCTNISSSIFMVSGLHNSTIKEYVPYCGNFRVDAGETCTSCPADAGACSSTRSSGSGSSGGSGGGSYWLPTATEPACNNSIKDGTETDVDCGGNCSPCVSGKNCSTHTDCLSGVCEASTEKCIVPSSSCQDNIKNQGETGIDCGGPCTACAQASPSQTDTQTNKALTSGSPSCQDNIQNQGETGIDCGGPCASCEPSDADKSRIKVALSSFISSVKASQESRWLWIIISAIILLLLGVIILLISQQKEEKDNIKILKQEEEKLRKAMWSEKIRLKNNKEKAGSGVVPAAELANTKKRLEQERKKEQKLRDLLAKEKLREKEEAKHLSQELERKKHELSQYIKSMSLAGYSKLVIRNKIIKTGWPAYIADELIAENYINRTNIEIQRLAEFIGSQKLIGKSNEEIRQFLVIGGWDNNLIDEAFKIVDKNN